MICHNFHKSAWHHLNACDPCETLNCLDGQILYDKNCKQTAFFLMLMMTMSLKNINKYYGQWWDSSFRKSLTNSGLELLFNGQRRLCGGDVAHRKYGRHAWEHGGVVGRWRVSQHCWEHRVRTGGRRFGNIVLWRRRWGWWDQNPTPIMQRSQFE